jgi:hypothetical protein
MRGAGDHETTYCALELSGPVLGGPRTGRRRSAAVLALQQMERQSHETDAVPQQPILLHDVLGTQWALAGEEQRALATSDEAYRSRP